MPAPPPGDAFRIAFVAGVAPDKWLARWRERFPESPLEVALVHDADQVAVLADGRADMVFARLPVDTEMHHTIRLYDEVPVVVVPVDHPVAAYDEVALADLAGEQLIQDPATLPGWDALDTPARLDWPEMSVKEQVEVVASGGGIVVVPMSLARLHHRKDVTSRPVTDGPVSGVALVWPRTADDPRIDLFIGIVRGRSENSSRGQAPAAKEKKKPSRAPAPARRKPQPRPKKRRR